MPIWTNFVVTGSSRGWDLYASSLITAKAMKQKFGRVIVQVIRKG